MNTNPDSAMLAMHLLRTVRSGGNTLLAWQQLAQLSREQLAADLEDEAVRKAFFLNLYNACVQQALQQDAGSFEHKSRFFGKPLVVVAGCRLSLDDIEHGLLRRSLWKWGMGYICKPFAGSFEKSFRLRHRDYRIHFALNCGAASCPPIVLYDAGQLDQQLELATAAYLQQEVRYDTQKNQVFVPKLFLWFRGDFGGASGIRKLLAGQGLIPDGLRPVLRYAHYDWHLQSGKYR